MSIKDLLHETGTALTANKVRSSLTMLGIVIGIASVIAMLAIGQGASASIQSSIQSIGSNLIIVMPGAQRGPGTQVSSGRGTSQSLTMDDSNAIQNEISEVKSVSPEVDARAQVVYKGSNTNTSVVGTVPLYTEVHNIEIDEGSFLSDQDIRGLAKVAVLGPTTRDDLFGAGAESIGQTIRIKNIDFKIIGVTKTKGGSGFGSSDDRIYIPISSAQKFLVGNSTYVSTISVEAQSADVMKDTQDQITSLLLSRHHISDPNNADFSTLNQADILSTLSTVTNTFTMFLASIAGISLLVGGIGIMNMMLTTVTERTKEIGLRKAVGAKKNDIRTQFLTEALMLTFIGGVIGVILGWGIAFAISLTGLVNAQVTLTSVILAFGVSAIIGIVFGYYPARRASNLSPIEALRYE